MSGLYLSTRNGMAERVTGEVERLTGRKPIAFAQYVRDYQDAWASDIPRWDLSSRFVIESGPPVA